MIFCSVIYHSVSCILQWIPSTRCIKGGFCLLILIDFFHIFLAILVTGGRDEDGNILKSAEVLSTNGSSLCSLPDMSQSKMQHTQSGLIACGGYDIYENRLNCTKFVSGSWVTLPENLLFARYSPSSWINPEGDILLIGGSGWFASETTEILYKNGSSSRSFNLKYFTE